MPVPSSTYHFAIHGAPCDLQWGQYCYSLPMNIDSIPCHLYLSIYEGCLKRIAYFYLETSNFKSKNSLWLEMHSCSRCSHFLKALGYADLGTVIRYWWIADQSACQDWYFRPARNYFNLENIKKSHWTRSMDYGRWCKTVTSSFFKNAVTIS